MYNRKPFYSPYTVDGHGGLPRNDGNQVKGKEVANSLSNGSSNISCDSMDVYHKNPSTGDVYENTYAPSDANLEYNMVETLDVDPNIAAQNMTEYVNDRLPIYNSLYQDGTNDYYGFNEYCSSQDPNGLGQNYGHYSTLDSCNNGQFASVDNPNNNSISHDANYQNNINNNNESSNCNWFYEMGQEASDGLPVEKYTYSSSEVVFQNQDTNYVNGYNHYTAPEYNIYSEKNLNENLYNSRYEKRFTDNGKNDDVMKSVGASRVKKAKSSNRVSVGFNKQHVGEGEEVKSDKKRSCKDGLADLNWLSSLGSLNVDTTTSNEFNESEKHGQKPVHAIKIESIESLQSIDPAVLIENTESTTEIKGYPRNNRRSFMGASSSRHHNQNLILRTGSLGDRLKVDLPEFNIDRDFYKYTSTIKPPFSYSTIICMAMKETKNRKMTLAGIYKWIIDNFLYFRMADQCWQNSIRHNLSLNKCFQKVPRTKEEPGKGGFWRIHSDYEDLILDSPLMKSDSNSPIEEDENGEKKPNIKNAKNFKNIRYFTGKYNTYKHQPPQISPAAIALARKHILETEGVISEKTNMILQPKNTQFLIPPTQISNYGAERRAQRERLMKHKINMPTTHQQNIMPSNVPFNHGVSNPHIMTYSNVPEAIVSSESIYNKSHINRPIISPPKGKYRHEKVPSFVNIHNIDPCPKNGSLSIESLSNRIESTHGVNVNIEKAKNTESNPLVEFSKCIKNNKDFQFEKPLPSNKQCFIKQCNKKKQEKNIAEIREKRDQINTKLHAEKVHFNQNEQNCAQVDLKDIIVPKIAPKEENCHVDFLKPEFPAYFADIDNCPSTSKPPLDYNTNLQNTKIPQSGLKPDTKTLKLQAQKLEKKKKVIKNRRSKRLKNAKNADGSQRPVIHLDYVTGDPLELFIEGSSLYHMDWSWIDPDEQSETIEAFHKDMPPKKE